MIDKEKQNILSNWVKTARSTLAVKRIHMSSETTHVLAHADVLEDDHGSTTYNSDFNRRWGRAGWGLWMFIVYYTVQVLYSVTVNPLSNRP